MTAMEIKKISARVRRRRWLRRLVLVVLAKTTQVTVNMLAAESIIVGAVPEGFVGYNLSGEELNLVQ